jgi:hypothetical protein
MPDALVSSPRILFLALTNDVGMDRVLAATAKLGAACALVSPPGFYSSKTRFIEHHFPLSRHYGIWLGMAFVRRRLENAVRTWQPDMVVPLDDVASNLLRGLALTAPAGDRLGDLIKTSLGASGGYPAASSRAELMRVAAAAEVRIPRFHVAGDAAETMQTAHTWGYPVVLKSEQTCGGNGVVIAAGPQALHAALTPPSGRTGIWRRCRRAGRDWMWQRAGLARGAEAAPVMQSLIRGVPAMRTVAAWNGQVLAGASFVAERTHPAPTGASSVVRHVEHSEMETAVRRMVQVLGCSGFVSFDFMLDEAQEAAYLIEMNPRPIGTTHLGRLFGHDIVGALLTRLGHRPVAASAMRQRADRRVAMFPRELERDPLALERLRSGVMLHDVPNDDPAVLAAYVQRLAKIHPGAAADIAACILPSPIPGADTRHGSLGATALAKSERPADAFALAPWAMGNPESRSV